MKVASFWGGGGGGRGVPEEVETLGEAPPPLNNRLPIQGQSKTNEIYAVFLYSVTPPPPPPPGPAPPRVSGSAPAPDLQFS